MATKTTVLGSTIGVRPLSYDAANGVLVFPRRNKGTVNALSLISIFNETTNRNIYDNKNNALGGSFNLPKDKGNITLTLDFSDARYLGTNDDVLLIMVEAPASLISDSALKATNTLLSNSSFNALERIENSNAVSVGDFGFAIIGSGDAAVVGSFSSIMSLSDGTVLDSSCTTSSGHSNLSAYSLVAGTTISAPWTKLEVTAGAVLAMWAAKPTI